MTRVFGILITGTWLLAMSALVRRDILPFWSATDPPDQRMPSGEYQIGMFDKRNHRMGTAWITTRQTDVETSIQSTTQLEVGGRIPILPKDHALVIDSSVAYGQDGIVSRFSFDVQGIGIPIQVNGERILDQYVYEAKFGESTTKGPLENALALQCLGESFRPFTFLNNLHVGQSWRMRSVDPLSIVTQRSLQFKMIVATVTRRESIEHAGKRVECFRIETEDKSSIAWANDEGRVLRQQVEMPFDRMILIDEPFDAKTRQAARRGTDKVKVES